MMLASSLILRFEPASQGFKVVLVVVRMAKYHAMIGHYHKTVAMKLDFDTGLSHREGCIVEVGDCFPVRDMSECLAVHCVV
jgi:hypothetical protein